MIGISGARRNTAVSLCLDGRLQAFCEQERVTRVRHAGLSPGSLPHEAIDAVLASAGGVHRSQVNKFATADRSIDIPVATPVVRLDHHEAHATTAFHLSPFHTSAILICDRRSTDHSSVWIGGAERVVREDWPTDGDGFAAIYSECGAFFGFPHGAEHELEALARLDVGTDADRLTGSLRYHDGGLRANPGWDTVIRDWLAEPASDPLKHRARVASAIQRRLGQILLELVADIRTRGGRSELCLGGGLFYNTYFTTLVQQSGIFNEVFVAPNPGNAGTAIGAALHAADRPSRDLTRPVSPFLGPEYNTEEIKRTLDNCKLSFEFLNDREIVRTTVDALLKGRLVGWFQGRMEWGHRALGNRSILASPLSPYVLDNLNVFLKHRQRHRTYGVSVPVERVSEFFDGPAESRFMEYEYHARNPEQFRQILPERAQAVRVQTVPKVPDAGSNDLFRAVHEEVGAATGIPVLINTSFNGFSEPMVCSPRDAIRVFYGTGLDILVLDRFLIRK